MKNKTIWIIGASVVVVGVGLFFLVRANKEKLQRKQWEAAGSPGSFDDWKRLTLEQKQKLAGSKIVPAIEGDVPSLATPGVARTGLKLDTGAIAGAVAGLFGAKQAAATKTGDAKIDARSEAAYASAQKARTASISSGLKTYAQGQFGTQI